MKTTENYNLNKPDADDFFSHEHMNQNMDVIDGELKQTVTTKKNQGLSDTEKSNARANIGASENGHTHDDKVTHKTITTATDFNTMKETCIYHIRVIQSPNSPQAGYHGTLICDFSVATPYQIFIPDSLLSSYKRTYKNNVFSDWNELKFTDTVYTHPTTAGNKHIPSGGASGQYLKWSADGTAKWEDEIITITKTLTVGTSWIDTGIVGSNLSSGSYIIQVSGMTSGATSMFSEVFTGVMTWHAGDTNSGDSDEIILHNAGHVSNGRKIYLRTLRQPSNNGAKVKLQIAANNTFASSSYTFKFRKMI